MITESIVWVHALAVLEILFFYFFFNFICKKVVILIKNPVIPVTVIITQNFGLKIKYTVLISPISPDNNTIGKSKIKAKVVL